MRQPLYTRCVVICHGYSELQIAKYIKSKLHLKMELISKDNGAHSIQITSLLDLLNNRVFLNINNFAHEYDVEIVKKELKNFKLFIIMDTDDCTDKQKEDFISKKMFENHPLYEYIYPIYNIINLEDVLHKTKIMAKKIKDCEKGTYYLKTFPIDHSPRFTLNSKDEIDLLSKKLSKTKDTNLFEFFNYCLNLVENKR